MFWGGSKATMVLTLKSILLSALFFSKPLFAEQSQDLESAKDSVLIKTHHHFFTLTADHVYQMFLLYGNTNVESISNLEITPYLSGNSEDMRYPFALSFTATATSDDLSRIDSKVDRFLIVQSSGVSNDTLDTIQVGLGFCDTSNLTELHEGHFGYSRPVYNTSTTLKELDIKAFASSFEPHAENSIILKAGNSSMSLTAEQIHKILLLNDIKHIESIFQLQMINDDHSHIEGNSVYYYTIAFFVHLAEDAEPVLNNRVECALTLYISDHQVALTDCSNSELYIRNPNGQFSRGYHSASLEALGISKHIPKTEIN